MTVERSDAPFRASERPATKSGVAMLARDAGGTRKSCRSLTLLCSLLVVLVVLVFLSRTIGTHETSKEQHDMTAADLNMMMPLLTLLGMPGVSSAMFSVLLLLFVSHLSLPWQTLGWRFLRAGVLFPITAYLVFDMATNLRYSLGSGLRDLVFGTMAWHLIAKTIDVNLVTLFDDHAPRWCVPDWEKERSLFDDVNGAATVSRLAKAETEGRPLLSKRPSWAPREYMPVHWRLLNPPSRLFSKDRFLWAFDVLTLRRPGTSLLFPEQMRALEWSHKRLESTGRIHHHRRQQRPEPDLVPLPTKTDLLRQVPFGEMAVPLWRAALEACVARYAISKLNAYHFPPPVDRSTFFALPFLEQYVFAACVGSQIAFGASLPDWITVKIFRPLVPVTANLSSFQAPASATSLSDLWGNRWHAFSRRDLWRLSSLLFPFGSTKAGNVIGAFFFSGVFHSILFLRALQPTPMLSGSWKDDLKSWSPVLFQPGIVAFFSVQGLICVVERLFIDSRHPTLVRVKSLYEQSLPPWLRKAIGIAYTWGALLYMARWAAADAIATGLLTRENTHSLSPSAMWTDLRAFVVSYRT